MLRMKKVSLEFPGNGTGLCPARKTVLDWFYYRSFIR